MQNINCNAPITASPSASAQWLGEETRLGRKYSGIFSGRNNNVSGAASAILGGRNNNVASADSSILGGNGNVIPAGAAFNNRHIAGSAIALGPGVGYPNALHVNALWANMIPVFPAGFPYNAGTIFVVPVGVPPPGGIAGALYQM